MDRDDEPLNSDGIPEDSNGAAPSNARTASFAEEAEEDRNIFDEAEEEEEEDGEDLMGDEMFEDYRPMPELDRYDEEGLDDEPDEERDEDEIVLDRQRAEEEMERRDEANGLFNNRRLPHMMRERDGGEDEDEPARPRRRARAQRPDPDEAMEEQGQDLEEEDGDEEADVRSERLDRVQGNLREWVQKEEVRRILKVKFRHFLRTFRNPKDENKIEYIERIEQMMENMSVSLEVDYCHLIAVHTKLAMWLADVPAPVLETLDQAAMQVLAALHPKYCDHLTDRERIHVRISNLPIVDQIRNIRITHLNTLLKVGGVVTRRTGVFPQLQQVKYDCVKCGALLGPFFQNTASEIRIGSCPECQSKGPFDVNVEQTIYRNYQKLTLQESPGTVPAGRLPRHKEVVLLHDLIDCAKPGEEIEVTGVYSNNFDAALNTKNGFPVFSTVIEANHVSKKLDLFAAYKLTDEDKDEIVQLAADPRIATRIVKSIAPSIYGHDDIKTAVALAMFGGQEKNVGGKHRLRGDINCLLLGDPGTAKSQFLKYIEKTASRAVYTTGKGASAVGLTASVNKDPITREWTLEGGALVLADRGICLIDEFDKMNDHDRVSIHEAMEQQSISISKAGIVTSLQARCAVIAAANPIGGRYDSSKSFSENVELTDPILSRFDILCVIKDTVDPVIDEMLARFVVRSHHRSHPDNKGMDRGDDVIINTQGTQEQEDDILSPDALRKYMTYAKQTCFPKIQEAHVDKIAQVYADLRQQCINAQGIPLTVRHVEAVIRMSEAHARMHLRAVVSTDDVDMGVRVLLESFLGTQKYGVQKRLQKSFKKYMTYKKDFNVLLLSFLRALVKEAIRYQQFANTRSAAPPSYVDVSMEDLEARAADLNILDLSAFYQSSHFLDNHFTLHEAQRVIRHPLV